MNKYQIRALRCAFMTDRIYAKGMGYNNDLIDYPIMRKELKDVVILGKPLSKYQHWMGYRLTKGDNVYELWHVDYNHTSSTIAIITKNGKIIYWVTGPIGAPYHAAWRHLTGVYGGYGTGIRNGCWTWVSVDDFDCEQMGWIGDQLSKTFNDLPDRNWHTKYQNKMFDKTGRFYIDKRLVSQEVIDEKAKKEYYHM